MPELAGWSVSLHPATNTEYCSLAGFACIDWLVTTGVPVGRGAAGRRGAHVVLIVGG